MLKVKIIHTIKCNGKKYFAGAIIELPEKTATTLVKAGVVEIIKTVKEDLTVAAEQVIETESLPPVLQEKKVIKHRVKKGKK